MFVFSFSFETRAQDSVNGIDDVTPAPIQTILNYGMSHTLQAFKCNYIKVLILETQCDGVLVLFLMYEIEIATQTVGTQTVQTNISE